MSRLRVENASRNLFADKARAIQPGLHQVEELSGGGMVQIKKPGYKGTDDFAVLVTLAPGQAGRALKHAEMYEDIRTKLATDNLEGRKLISALRRVCEGEEPDSVLRDLAPFSGGGPGLRPEVLLKAYKWIWGQEDCNYPHGEGRYMSMREIELLPV